MHIQTSKNLYSPQEIIAIMLDLDEGSAIKFIAHRGFDTLLCHHVYLGFCQNCPQYKCRKRRV